MEVHGRWIREIVDALGGQEMLVHVPGDSFSVTEHVCHLRDLEKYGFRPRIVDMLTKFMPQLYDFEGAVVARDSNYSAQSVRVALADFMRARRQNVSLVRDAPVVAAGRFGHYASGPPLTFVAVLESVLEHDLDHISRLRSLADAVKHNRPKGFPENELLK